MAPSAAGRAGGGSGHHGRADDHRRRLGIDGSTAPAHRRRRAPLPGLDAVPGAADAQRHRQLLRAGAVRQQARGPRSGRSWSPASTSSAATSARTRQPGDLTIILDGRVFLSQPHDRHHDRPPSSLRRQATREPPHEHRHDDSSLRGAVSAAVDTAHRGARRRPATGSASWSSAGSPRAGAGRPAGLLPGLRRWRRDGHDVRDAAGASTSRPPAPAAPARRRPCSSRINAKSFGRDPFKALIVRADPVGAVGGAGTATAAPDRPPAAPRPVAPRPAARTAGGTGRDHHRRHGHVDRAGRRSSRPTTPSASSASRRTTDPHHGPGRRQELRRPAGR